MAGERRNWYPYFLPCGSEPVRGYALRRCFEGCQKGGANCLPGKAWQMAGYIINDGSSLRQERQDFTPYLRNMLGRTMVRTDGTSVTVTPENLSTLLDETVVKTADMLNAMSMCAEKTLPLTPDYLDRCTPEQRHVLDKVHVLSQQASRGFMHTSPQHVEVFIGDMKDALMRAIELDLDELGLITRQALAYGLGERVLAKRGIPVRNIPTQVGKLETSSPE